MSEYADLPQVERKNLAYVPKYKVESVRRELDSQIDWSLKLGQIPDLWNLTRGAGIKVAILDSGYAEHEDLPPVANITGINFTTGNKQNFVDENGHGTHVAGIIGGKDNAKGIVGVSPDVDLYIAKVLNKNLFSTPEIVIKGIEWALDHKVDIISMSLSFTGDHVGLHNAIKKASNNGTFVITSGGNHGQYLGYPAVYDECIAVGAMNKKKKVISATSKRNKMDVLAPGHKIRSTYLKNQYATLTGSSMAAPFVTGVVALMLAKHNDLDSSTPVDNVDHLRKHLSKTSEDLYDDGRDRLSGYGLINPTSLVRKKWRFF